MESASKSVLKFNVFVIDPVADLTMLSVAQQEAKQLSDRSDWQQQPENKALADFMTQKERTTYLFD